MAVGGIPIGYEGVGERGEWREGRYMGCWIPELGTGEESDDRWGTDGVDLDKVG